MNIDQMHVEITLSSQKIASNVKRKFLPEEIDWIINKTIGRFVKNKIKPNEEARENGFQSDGIDLNALRTLLVLDFPVAAYKTAVSDPFILAELPGDYSYLVEDYSGIVQDCHDEYNGTFIAGTEYAYYLKLIKSTKGSKNYYINPVLTVNGTVSMAITDFPSGTTGHQDKDMLFILEDAMKNHLLNTPGAVKVYWERYKNLYKPQTFIFISSTALGSGITLAFDSQTLTATTETLSFFKPAVDIAKDIRPNRLPKSSKIGDLQTSTFAKSQWVSPISQQSGNTIKVYHDTKFIVNNLRINYIRKPRLVSLSLGNGCDLPEDFHQDICDLAVEYMKQTIADPNYVWKLQDNQLRRE